MTSRAPEHSTQGLITQRVMQMIGGYPDGNDSNLLRRDPVLQMLVGKATHRTAAATPREPADDEPLGQRLLPAPARARLRCDGGQ
ncbi:MAG: transposase, partial [Verrucomicrobiaceae bacterium]